jgi:hypothetical protein
VVGGFFFENFGKHVSLGQRIERERPILAPEFWVLADNRFYDSRIFWRSQMILPVIVIRYLTEVCNLFFGHSFVMLAFYCFNE